MLHTKHFEQPECATCESRTRSVFCDLRGNDLEFLSNEKGCNAYKKGQVIFNKGSYPQGIFCIRDGKVKVYQVGDEGKEQIVRLAKSGDILGYRAVLSGDRYSSSAEALDDAKICFVPKQAFTKLIEQNGILSMQLMKLLSHDLKEAEHRITELAQKPVRERVAEALLYLQQIYGFEADGQTLNIAMSREDIANLVGTATETTIRLLSEFKSDEVIRLNGKKIAIINQKQLIRIANVLD